MKRRRTEWLACAVLAPVAASMEGAELWPQELQRVHQKSGTPLVLAGNGRASAEILLLSDSELIRNAAEWLRDYVRRTSGAELRIGGAERLKARGRYIVAVVGDQHQLVKQWTAAGLLQPEPFVGPQGFVIERIRLPDRSGAKGTVPITGPQPHESAPASGAATHSKETLNGTVPLSVAGRGEVLVCWSPTEIGCRYGLIEILRSLRVQGRKVETVLTRVVERPQFPVRICYVNFGEHLQNAYNPNVLFDTAVNRWSPRDWERFIDMISGFRFNIFEFWLVPTLFSPEALKGEKMRAAFAETMNHVIAYAKRRGIGVHPIVAVNTVGAAWHYHCPKDPKEHAEIVSLWDHWSRALKGNDYIGIFPGDPGGCTRNGCTARTYVDLCLELTGIIRKNNPNVTIEVGTWGEPFGGWGVPLWTGTPQRAAESMKYFLSKLPEFPSGTMTHINMGFSPDCLPTSHGGDGKPYAKAAARTNPVLTWDYSVTEGEGTVLPHCRVRRIFQRRNEELAVGCYSGGICYTMAPRLNCLSLFCSAEAYWNPALKPEAVLDDYVRLIFGEQHAGIGPLLEEFEVIPDWGYYAPFPYSPERLEQSMTVLARSLRKVDPEVEPRLPLAPTMAEYRKSLLFFAELFGNLGAIASGLEHGTRFARLAGKLPPDHKGVMTLDEIGSLLAQPEDFPQKQAIRDIARRIREVDIRSLRKAYWDTVYGIYDAVPHPTDPRAEGATNVLLRRFHGEAAMIHESSPPEKK
jgi:hypothetical protein